MTDDKKDDELDKDYVPVSRRVTPLGIGWSFEKWASQGDEWKNDSPYQILVGWEHVTRPLSPHKDKKFICVRTGAKKVISQKKEAQKLQKEALKKIPIPILWEQKGLPVDLCFFEYEIEKTSEK